MARFKLSNVCAVILSALAALAISTNAVSQQVTEVVRVDGENGSANPPGKGDDWGVDAYKYLPDGLARADEIHNIDPDIIVEIWVAAIEDGSGNPVGYRPDQDAANPGGTGLRTDSFELREDVKIYGGFDGTETDVDERDPENNKTILTGGQSASSPVNAGVTGEGQKSATFLKFLLASGV